MSVVDEVKGRLDIVDVVSDYVPLKKAGRNYKALCPFHSEKTPSFIVFPETQTWHCFGCGAGGDVFSFVMRYEHMGFGGALRLLAKRAGVSLRPKTKAQIAEEKRKERLREVNAAAADYFHNLLLSSPEGDKARAYLNNKRGLKPDTIERFQLGYALDSWDALKRYLLSKGYKLEDIHDAGLIVERRDGSGYYDRFRGRLMIPIRDERGIVVGFGGRVLDDSGPKYLNSPQTPLFDKSCLLYGLDLAKKAIRAEGLAVIVEGYMDVLTAHQNGFANVLASMGTSLTEDQLKRLAKFSGSFAFALDADAAGDAATLRSLALVMENLARRMVPVPTRRGIRYEGQLEADIRIITLPQGQDPDEVIRKSPAKWMELVKKALPVVDYYFQVVTAELDLSSAQGKSVAVRELTPVIGEIADPVRQAHYLQRLARLVRVDEKTLRREMGKREAKGKPEEGEPPVRDLAFGPEEYCLAFLLRKPDLLERLDGLMREVGTGGLSAEDFTEVENRQIFAALREQLTRVGKPDIDNPRKGLPKELHRRLEILLEQARKIPSASEEEIEKGVTDSALKLRRRSLERRIRELRFLQEDAREGGDYQAEMDYAHLACSYMDEVNSIHQALSARSSLRQHAYAR